MPRKADIKKVVAEALAEDQALRHDMESAQLDEDLDATDDPCYDWRDEVAGLNPPDDFDDYYDPFEYMEW